MTAARAASGYAAAWAKVDSCKRVAQCACGASAPWRDAGILERAGWSWRLTRNAVGTVREWACPDCSAIGGGA